MDECGTHPMRPALPYKRVSKFCEESGWSEAAVRRKIADGIWLEGKEYYRAPDRNILIDVEGVNRWVRGERNNG